MKNIHTAFPRSSIIYLPMLAFVLAGLLLGGCAYKGQVGRMLPNVGNMYVAKHYLGEPTGSQKLPNGNTSYEWRLDRTVLETAHYETRMVYMGHDCDGFPIYEEVEFFIPDRNVHQTCLVRILADSEDRVLQSDMQGSHCDVLLKVPTNY